MWAKNKVRESLFIEHSAVRDSDTPRTVHSKPSQVRMFG